MTSALQAGTPAADSNSNPTTDRETTSILRTPGIDGALPSGGPVRRRGTDEVRLARKAGLLYLVVAVLGGFAQMIRVRVYAPGDPVSTAANLVANAALVRLSFVADLLQNLVWLCLALVLHRLLAHAGRYLARAMVTFVVVSVAVASLNLVHQLGALLVATTPAYATAFGP